MEVAFAKTKRNNSKMMIVGFLSLLVSESVTGNDPARCVVCICGFDGAGEWWVEVSFPVEKQRGVFCFRVYDGEK